MAISVKCGQCAYSRAVPDEFAGKRGKCPKCGAVVQVPAAGAVTAVAPPEPPPAPAPVAEGDGGWSELSTVVSEPSPRSSRIGGDRSGSRRSSRSGSQSADGSRSRRGKAAARPVPGWMIAVSLGGLLLLAGAGGAYLLLGSDNAPQQASRKNKPTQKKTADTGETSKPVNLADAGKMAPPDEALGLKPAAATGDQRPEADAPLEDVFAWVKPGIVLIEVFSGGKQAGMGSGFVVDAAGLIITNYHVTAGGDAAYAVFTDDSRYEIAGYLAVKPEWDLAVLQLKEKPEKLRVLDLVHQDKPREASEVMAVGSPLGHTFVPTRGIVGKVVQATDLPPSARQFVLENTGHDEQFWIEHDAQISPGNSGGPLFNRAGDVIGVNSWVDTSVRFGYAIWSWYVHDLLKRKGSTPEPLAKYKKADVSPGQRLAQDLNLEGIQKAFDAAESLQWAPKTAADYLRLQELAKLLALGRHAEKLKLPANVAAKAVELSTKLASKTWSTEGQVKPINQLAVSEIHKPGNGTMVFGKITSKQPVENFTVLMIQVNDMPEMIAVPVLGLEAALAEGTQCLVMGTVSTASLPFVSPAQGRQDARLLEFPASVIPVKVE